MNFGGADEIRFERIGKAGVVTLTRPKALNALTHRMIKALSAALDAWEMDDDVALVVVMAEGRAFCVGGDILHIYEAGRAGNFPDQFFADEYRLNARIAKFPKPYVALIDGMVMGGGVGISLHGSCRVLTENAVVAMPEVGIGFFPDVGGSFMLPRLKGSFGIYMGLTGSHVRQGDALWCGLATHCVDGADLPAIVEALAKEGNAPATLKLYTKTPARVTDDAALHEIAQHFSLGTLDDVFASLKAQATKSGSMAAQALEALSAKSPTSLAVAFRQLKTGSMLEFDDCMRMEFRIVHRMLRGHDFYEGIRATVIDKGSSPLWEPPDLVAVAEETVEAYFAPLPGGELEL